MTTTLVRRILPLVGIAVLMAASLRQQQLPEPTFDLFFHLRFGDEFLDEWSIRAPGHLGRFDTSDWVATQWLPQIALAKLAGAWGLAAVLWIVGSLVVLLICFLYVTYRRDTAPLPAALAVGLTYMATAPVLGPRPQLLSYVLIAVFVTAWLKTMRDHRPRYWLIALAWLWPMLHGMWPAGLLLGVATVVGIALERQASPATVRRLAAIPVLSLIATACTPVGPDIYRSVGSVGSRASYFAEWGPPSFTSLTTLPLVVLAAVVVLDAIRRDAVRWSEMLWLGLAVAWALYSVRTTPIAALMLGPFFARAIQRLVPSVPPPSWRETSFLVAASVIASAAFVPVAISRTESPIVPTWLDSQLDAIPAGSGVLNDWDLGPYVLWRHPDLQWVMHGYGDVFTDEEIERNADIARQQPGWRERVADLAVDVAFVDPDTALGYALMADNSGWEVIEADDDYAVLERTVD